MLRLTWLALTLVGVTVSPAAAHFNMLLPQTPSVKRGEAVTVVYQWGHPFEHQLFNAPPPAKLLALSPGGTSTDLLKALEKFRQQGVTGYRFRFSARERGDFVFVLNTPPIWMEEDQEFLQDTVKVVLHVQAQKGWDQTAGQGFEMAPLTRPYGLQPGMVFQTQVLGDGKPSAGTLVEIEHYHPEAPRELPPDEQMTHTAKTDRNGVVTCTLTEPGWWCLTAGRDGGRRKRQGQAYPVRQRTTLWVFVDDKIGSKRAR
ncbi:MAG TPA: DUF4198 domain-containing protein [Gemmataceae bacterium]|nr:DUF4198 domain-containing protein [Gemmataceae bacterium]